MGKPHFKYLERGNDSMDKFVKRVNTFMDATDRKIDSWVSYEREDGSPMGLLFYLVDESEVNE